MSTDEMGQLVKSNWTAAGAHLASAAVVLALYSAYTAAQERAYANIYRYQIAGPTTPNECNTSGGPPPTPDQCNVDIVFQQPKYMARFNIIYGVLAFFLFTAMAHVYYASDGFGNGNYFRVINEGWNPFRWYEYGLSASLMSVLIGLVDGTRDSTALVALVALTAGTMGCGLVVESALRASITQVTRDTVNAATGVGWTLFLGIWAVLLFQFAYVVWDVDHLYEGQLTPAGNPVKVPSWIWFVVLAQLFFYACFGIVQWRHIKARFSRATSFSYVKTEKAYIFLSFFAKLALAGGIGYGLIIRAKDCN